MKRRTRQVIKARLKQSQPRANAAPRGRGKSSRGQLSLAPKRSRQIAATQNTISCAKSRETWEGRKLTPRPHYCVAPGPVWTPLNPSDKGAEDVAKFGAETPLERPAQPEEIAPAYVYFASDVDSSYVT